MSQLSLFLGIVSRRNKATGKEINGRLEFGLANIGQSEERDLKIPLIGLKISLEVIC